MPSFPKIKNYIIVDILGQGGAGIVYDAIDLRDGTRVAIKSLYPSHLRNNFVRNCFIQEANNYLYLAHPNIVQLKDLLIIPDIAYYLVMEHINGYTLDNYVQNISGPISQERVCTLFSQVLQAIAHAHHNGTIHLDIKPSNILINDQNHVKVVDFGIAQSINKGTVKQNIGTPMYMSPEQIQKKALNRQSDIYSLGVTLHHMVTGQLPYSGRIGQQALFEKVLTQPLPRAKSFYPLVSDKMQAIIDKATQKNPKDRFQSCEEFEINLYNLMN